MAGAAAANLSALKASVAAGDLAKAGTLLAGLKARAPRLRGAAARARGR